MLAPWLTIPCFAAPPESAAPVAAPDAAALVATLRRVPPARSVYSEVRFSDLLDRPLRDLDRVEVYRGLRVDPMQARRERHAGHQAKAQVAAQLAARRKKGKGPR